MIDRETQRIEVIKLDCSIIVKSAEKKFFECHKTFLPKLNCIFIGRKKQQLETCGNIISTLPLVSLSYK